MLTVLTNSIPKVKPDYNSIYHEAFKRALKRPNIHQAIFYGVKYIVTMSEPEKVTIDEAMLKFEIIHIVTELISMVTPGDLIQIFPVSKEFDGEKWGSKDYFYTMQTINQMGINEVIGNKVQDLLWDYQNTNISEFLVALLSNLSDIRRLHGHKGIAEEFCEEQGIPMYTTHKDASDCEYLQDNTTGKAMRLKRKMPRYIKCVK